MKTEGLSKFSLNVYIKLSAPHVFNHFYVQLICSCNFREILGLNNGADAPLYGKINYSVPFAKCFLSINIHEVQTFCTKNEMKYWNVF